MTYPIYFDVYLVKISHYFYITKIAYYLYDGPYYFYIIDGQINKTKVNHIQGKK